MAENEVTKQAHTAASLTGEEISVIYRITGNYLAKVGQSGGAPDEAAARKTARKYLLDTEGLSGAQVDKYIKKANAADPTKRKPLNLPPEAKQIDAHSFHVGIFLFKKVDARKPDSPFILERIYRPALLEMLQNAGYCKRYDDDSGTPLYIKETNNIIEVVTIPQIRDFVLSTAITDDISGVNYSATKAQQLDILARNSLSTFNDGILGLLQNHTKPLLSDGRETAYFPFKNVVAKVTAKGVQTIQYSELKDLCIWKQHTIDREFSYSPDFMQSQFAGFISNVATDLRVSAFFSAIGYLLHNYSSPKDGRAVIGYDEELAPKNKPQGGTGKGIIIQALGQLRNIAVIDGKKTQDNDRFSYQSVTPQTQIIAFDDVKPNFNFHMLNSNLTLGWQIEQKGKAPFRFVPSHNPKTYISSNNVLQAEGTTATRRKFELEFSNKYSLLARRNKEPIIEVHGSVFFSNEYWDQKEWDMFFSYMMEATAYYFEHGLVFVESQNIQKNALIQRTATEFYDFMLDQKGLNDWQPYSSLYQNFLSFADYTENDLSTKRFTNWLKLYAEAHRLEYQNKIQSNNNKKEKFCRFIQSVTAK